MNPHPHQISREIFFNLGGPEGSARMIVYGLAIVVLAIFARQLFKKAKAWSLGKSDRRLDAPLNRIWLVVKYALLQWRLFKDLYPGLMHAAIFFGFAALFAGTATIVIQEDVTLPIFGARFFHGPFYKVYSLVLDIFGAVAVLGVAVALFRRYVQRPERLDNRPTDLCSLVLILAVLLTGFVNEGLRMSVTEAAGAGRLAEYREILERAEARSPGFLASVPDMTDAELLAELERLQVGQDTKPGEVAVSRIRNAYYANPELAGWSPVGLLVARSSQLLFSYDGRLALHRINWWVHLLLAMGLIVYLVPSKLFHIIASCINIFLRKTGPVGELSPIHDMENAETFGVGTVEDFTWKQLLEGDACTRCGRCQDNCPAWLSGKPLSPKKIIQDVHGNLIRKSAHRGGPSGEGKTGADPLLGGNGVQLDEIWSCTTCMSCQEQCPVAIEHVQKIVDMRRHKVLMEGEMSPELQTAMRNMENNSNPYGIGFSERGSWTEGLPVRTLAEKADVEYLYFVGCAGSFDDRSRKVAAAFVRVMEKAGIRVGVLGKEEGCCGDSVRRAGNEYLFAMMAERNIETFRNYGVRRIVTTCPHGYNCLKNEYPQFGGDFEVFHHTELLADLLMSGRIKLSKAPDGLDHVAYHDSCFLGRYNGLYEAPRRIVRSIPGAELKEFSRRKSKSFCCGGGGGRMWMEEHLGRRINQMRVQDAVERGYAAIGTACPFCLTMLGDGIKELGREESMAAYDLAELVEMAMA